MNSSNISLALHHLFFLVFIFIHRAQAQVLTKQKISNTSVSALFVFGDSSADSGNNNFILTLAKANFQPYGRDFVDHKPTGRFSNGRLVSDFISSYLGFEKYPAPYVDPMLSMEDMETGVCFASAGSGYDPLTPILNYTIILANRLWGNDDDVLFSNMFIKLTKLIMI
ncbi:unnamed protein product [Ilex paraguariensis]|uniref:GDSL esterase/lipase n=1 Tax=Ilex paraguariensis TaxID=185542 RepID=A0ABC8RVU0_9AQUA